MSGGSYDYAYRAVEQMADELRIPGNCRDINAGPELRELFRAHLRKVAAAMKAIEWNDSCDGDDGEKKLILECLRLTEDGTPEPMESAARVIAEAKLKAIRALIGDAS